jgi:hypothetical protein
MDYDVCKKYLSETFYKKFQTITGKSLADIINTYFVNAQTNTLLDIRYRFPDDSIGMPYRIVKGINTDIRLYDDVYGRTCYVYAVASPVVDVYELTDSWHGKHSHTSANFNYVNVDYPVKEDGIYKTRHRQANFFKFY